MKKILAHLILLGDPLSVPPSDLFRYFGTVMAVAVPTTLIAESAILWFNSTIIFWSILMLILCINMVVGAYVHFTILKTFTWKDFILKNAVMWGICAVSFVVLDSVRFIYSGVNSNPKESLNLGAEMFSRLLQISTILFPGSKIIKNIYIISEGKYPPEFIMKRLYTFEKSGDLSKLIKTEGAEDSPIPAELQELKDSLTKSEIKT